VSPSDGIAANEGAQNRARRRDRLEERQRIADLKAVMATPAGRRVFMRILGDCGVYASSVIVPDLGPIDSNRTHFHEGRRNFGLELLAELEEADPGLWIQMHTDRLNEKQRAEVARKAEESDAGTDRNE
jgi:hypothetical protein